MQCLQCSLEELRRTSFAYLQKGHIKEETLKRLEVDEEVLGEFFREIITPAVSIDIYF